MSMFPFTIAVPIEAQHLFLPPRFVASLREKSHGNKTGCIFAEQFLENAQTKTTTQFMQSHSHSLQNSSCNHIRIHCKAVHAIITCQLHSRQSRSCNHLFDCLKRISSSALKSCSPFCSFSRTNAIHSLKSFKR